MRQDGYATGDTVDPDTETKRRIRDVAEAPKAKEAPFARTVKPDPTAPTLPTPPGPDRLHKFSSHVVWVSNDHSEIPPDIDPIINPGYKDPVAIKSTVQGGIAFAQALAANLTNPDEERIVVIVFGGYYEEDLSIPAGVIDLMGIGRPIIKGNHNLVLSVEGFGNRTFICDLELWGTDDTLVLPTLNIALLGDFPATTRTLVEIDRCYIHGPATAIYNPSSRINVYRSIIEVDYLSDDYTNIDTPAMFFGQNDLGYNEVRECYIAGVEDLQSPVGAAGYPNRGLAIELQGTDAPWTSTGVIVRNSVVTGYCKNYIWNIIFDHCDLYAGKKHATAGTKFMIAYGDSDSGVQGSCTYDHCAISTRYIAEEIDIGGTPTAGAVNEYIQHTKQLSYDTLDSSNDPLGQTVFGNMLGNTYVTHSSTWREYWNFNGATEAAVVNINSDVLVPIAACVSDYLHW